MELPSSISRYLNASALEAEDIGRSGAQVMRCGDMFLKIDREGALQRSAIAQEYFAKMGLSAPLAAYERENGCDFLLVKAVPGENACAEKYLQQPERLAAMLGETMRMLHETDAADCTLLDANERALSMYTAENGGSVHEGAALLKKEVLVHGDHCLPNIFFENGRFTGYIDLGDAGIGDRHLDICCAAWSLGYNTGSGKWADALKDAYGRELIDERRLRICMQLYGYEE